MSLAIIQTRAQIGIAAPPVQVEVHLAGGLPGVSIVGLPETAVKESRDRVKAALLNCQFEFPQRKVTLSLAPADLPKEGGRYDLPIAIGILVASRQLPRTALEDYEFIGELSLDGSLRSIPGALPVALACRGSGRKLIAPRDNGAEAALAEGAEVYTADGLLEVCAHLRGQGDLPPAQARVNGATPQTAPDLSEVKGHARAKRALEVAAAGQHGLLFMGPPGTGKTLLASRLPGLLPELAEDQAIETAAVRSIAGEAIDPERWRLPPYRSPHHTASGVALVGGGSRPRPGEISLAHNGVLFLDEIGEFDRRVLEVLREPLESGRITISRAARRAEFPARFQLVAAMNPCPCGYAGESTANCRCSAEQVQRYRARVSGPLMDRIDLQVEVPRQPARVMSSDQPEESSTAVRQRVAKARTIQLTRQDCTNAQLDTAGIRHHCGLKAKDLKLLETACERLGLSARAYHRILKLSRTIADLGESEVIQTPHLTEAIAYRGLDRRPVGL